MKKILTCVAVSAIALSFTFAGCSKDEKGVIKGKYEQKTPEQMEEILSGIDEDKLSSSSDAGTGFRCDFSGKLTMPSLIMSGSVSMDIKTQTVEDALFGAGSLSAKYNVSGEDEASNGTLDAKVYMDDSFIYTDVNSKTDGEEESEKIKLRTGELLSLIESMGDYTSSTVDSAPSSIDIASLLTLADEYGIEVSADTTDGVKFKLSATEESFWKILSSVNTDYSLEDYVTFNAFRLEIYYAIASDGTFGGTSGVVDIDMKIMPNPDSPEDTIGVSLKGWFESYLHSDSVTVPEEVANDTQYIDYTNAIKSLINQYI